MGWRIKSRVDDQRVGFDPSEQSVFRQDGRRRRARDDPNLRRLQTRVAQGIQPLERTVLVVCRYVARSIIGVCRLNDVGALSDPWFAPNIASTGAFYPVKVMVNGVKARNTLTVRCSDVG